jgi:hypothetical protein
MPTEEQKKRVGTLKKRKRTSRLLPSEDSAKLAAIAQRRRLAKATMVELDRKKGK